MHYNFDFKNVYDNYFIKEAAFGEIYRFGQNDFELLSEI